MSLVSLMVQVICLMRASGASQRNLWSMWHASTSSLRCQRMQMYWWQWATTILASITGRLEKCKLSFRGHHLTFREHNCTCHPISRLHFTIDSKFTHSLPHTSSHFHTLHFTFTKCAFFLSASPYLVDRFQRTFDVGPVKLVQIAGVTFVILNSMAMEGDDCFLCRPAKNKIKVISSKW